MVLCFIALPVFLIMGVFSVKYRILAKDAFECLGRTIIFKKCKSNLDDKIKSHITGKVIKKSPKIGLFFYKNFQLLSIIFIIIFVLSFFLSITGYINYLKYGNCYGPEDNNYFCPYTELFGDECIASSCDNEDCDCLEGDDCICEGEGCK